MKRIISGKSYDTSTARKVYEWSSTLGRSDFGYCEEELYCKKTGEYFLHGKGGPASKYAQAVGHSSWTGGERIMPLTYAEAQEWAERHMGEDYVAEFGEPDEGDVHHIHAVVSEAAWRALSRAAQDGRTSVGAVIEQLAASL